MAYLSTIRVLGAHANKKRKVKGSIGRIVIIAKLVRNIDRKILKSYLEMLIKNVLNLWAVLTEIYRII
tara:strand:+ start:773 stop:976 length:204 start_codon:yes stop_codon:yes gene_type:complete